MIHYVADLSYLPGKDRQIFKNRNQTGALLLFNDTNQVFSSPSTVWVAESL